MDQDPLTVRMLICAAGALTKLNSNYWLWATNLMRISQLKSPKSYFCKVERVDKLALPSWHGPAASLTSKKSSHFASLSDFWVVYSIDFSRRRSPSWKCTKSIMCWRNFLMLSRHMVHSPVFKGFGLLRLHQRVIRLRREWAAKALRLRAIGYNEPNLIKQLLW